MVLAITAWLLSFFLPWWSLAVPCIIFGAGFGNKGKSAFLYGFLGIGVLWFVQALIIHISHGAILTARIAELFRLPHPLLVIVVPVLIGGLAGGFSTLTGYLFKQAFLAKN